MLRESRVLVGIGRENPGGVWAGGWNAPIEHQVRHVVEVFASVDSEDFGTFADLGKSKVAGSKRLFLDALFCLRP